MEPLINYEGVDVMRSEHLVLRNVSLSVNQGELVYLIGKVGCGKSSLLKTFYGEVPVNTGTAQVLDYDLIHLRRKQLPYLRRNIGIVFQDFRLLTDRNVFANLEFVLRATGMKNRLEIDNRIGQVLAQVGMENKGYKMPHELSGGEQQRISIARALLNEPRIILADEPTGNLDPVTGEQILAQLSQIASQGTAVIIATHNHAALEAHPGRILQCVDKKLTEDSIIID